MTGDAATFVDQQNAIGSHLPEAIILLAVLTFLVLWLMTGSVVLPLKAIVMNALTVGASLAPLILIYQHGNLTGLLGYTSDGGVEPTDFVVAATVVFALSTDYGVFLLGRIKEAREASAVSPPDEREAVATGLGATGRVVTAAAILLAVAIGAFSTSSISFIQEIGVAVATGVLLDAFIVRSLLVPSLMALLGRWNWWAPSGLNAAARADRAAGGQGARRWPRPPYDQTGCGQTPCPLTGRPRLAARAAGPGRADHRRGAVVAGQADRRGQRAVRVRGCGCRWPSAATSPSRCWRR